MSRARGGAKLSVGMYTTVGDRCGIADYTRALTDALAPTVEVATIPLRPGRLNPVAIVRAGVRLSRKDVAHVQHTYSFFGVDQLTYTLLVRLLRVSVRAPLVLTAHTVRQPGPSRLEGGLGSALANAVGAPAWHDVETFRHAEMVVVHARLHRDRLLARGVAPERCRVIPPGVPPRAPVAPAERVAFRARRGLGERPVVGVFGFLERSKRFSVVLEALAMLRGGRGDGPVLVLAGGPRLPEHEPVVAEIKALAAQTGIADRVVVTGYLGRGEVPVALEAMDVVVVPYATDDSVSYSLHLALAQGRPVVATDLDPLREIQERGRCLLLVRPDDAGDLANALGTLLGDEGARRRLMTAAAAYARAESVAVAARRTLDAYEAARETRHG
jgi:glycosyltransferase involved in cell wall biosynthesis